MTSVFDTEADDTNDGQEMTIQNVGTGLLQGISNIMEVAAWNASVSFGYFTARRKKRSTGSEFKNENVSLWLHFGASENASVFKMT